MVGRVIYRRWFDAIEQDFKVLHTAQHNINLTADDADETDERRSASLREPRPCPSQTPQRSKPKAKSQEPRANGYFPDVNRSCARDWRRGLREFPEVGRARPCLRRPGRKARCYRASTAVLIKPGWECQDSGFAPAWPPQQKSKNC